MTLNELGRQNFIRWTNSDSRLLRKYFIQLSIFKSGDLNFCIQGTPSRDGCSGYCSTPEKNYVISASHLRLHLTASHADNYVCLTSIAPLLRLTVRPSIVKMNFLYRYGSSKLCHWPSLQNQTRTIRVPELPGLPGVPLRYLVPVGTCSRR